MYGLTKRDPMLDLLYQLESRMGRSFSEPVRSFEWPVPEAATTAWLPLVDVFEEPDVIRLVAEVPGVRPEDVKITVGALQELARGLDEHHLPAPLLRLVPRQNQDGRRDASSVEEVR